MAPDFFKSLDLDPEYCKLPGLLLLAEGSVGSFEAMTLPDHSRSIAFLSGIGAVKKGSPLSVLTCRACHDDHPVPLEFDPETRRYWYFCPEAGRVMVEDEDTATIRADLEWRIG